MKNKLSKHILDINNPQTKEVDDKPEKEEVKTPRDPNSITDFISKYIKGEK